MNPDPQLPPRPEGPRVELLPPYSPLPLPLPPPIRPPAPPRYGLAALLFLATFFCTTTLGAAWCRSTYQFIGADISTGQLPLLLPYTVTHVWRDPALLSLGLSFSMPALLILMAHEMGHYFTCRHYGLPATLPYFLPSPAGIGTLGAFIRIQSPIRSKRELFDVGVAGPIAGFVALLPFLFYGVAYSRVVAMPPPADGAILLVPGRSLAIQLATLLYHGHLRPGTMLALHPFALAAWFGLLATSLNLLPLGQLDGGHILYSVFGRRQRRLALPLWLALAAAGLRWPGWWLWCGIVLVMGLFHPPVRDEQTPLDGKRRLIALGALLLLILSFMPVPLVELTVR